jgi:hypothetical protein
MAKRFRTRLLGPLLCALFLPGIAAALDVKAFGAVGDGESYPACATLKLPNLAALQRHRGGLYAFATSCMHELDWLAGQAAINAAMASGGGVVRYPAGTYRHDATLTLPEASHGAMRTPGAGVSIHGDGAEATALVWPKDLGDGRFAIACAARNTTRVGCAGSLQDFRIRGPGLTGEIGKYPARMDGFGWGARRHMLRVAASGFRACLVISGDQTRFADLYLHNCRYGIYWDKPNPTLFGDLMFERVVISDMTLAGLALSPDAIIGESHFVSCIIGATPYGIYKETGGSTDTVLHGTEFQSMQFENIGNALLADDRTPATRRAVAYNSRFVQTQFLWNAAYALPATEAAAIFDLRQFYLVTIDGLREPGSWAPGSRAVFNLDIPGHVELRGDVETVMRLAENAGRPFAHIAGGGTQTFRIAQTGSWSGLVLNAHDGAPIRAGDVVAAAGAEFRRSTGAVNEAVWGIAMSDARGPAGQASFILANRGVVPARAAGDMPAGTRVAAGVDGTVRPANGQPAIGILLPPEGGVAQVRLQGLD